MNFIIFQAVWIQDGTQTTLDVDKVGYDDRIDGTGYRIGARYDSLRAFLDTGSRSDMTYRNDTLRQKEDEPPGAVAARWWRRKCR